MKIRLWNLGSGLAAMAALLLAPIGLSEARAQEGRELAAASAQPAKKPVPLGVACFGDTVEEAYGGLYMFMGYVDDYRVDTKLLSKAKNCKDYQGQASIVLGADAAVATSLVAVALTRDSINAGEKPPRFSGEATKLRKEIRSLCDNNDKHPRHVSLERFQYQITRTVHSSGWRLFVEAEDGGFREAVDPEFDKSAFVVATTRAVDVYFDDLCQLSRHSNDFEQRFEAYFDKMASGRKAGSTERGADR